MPSYFCPAQGIVVAQDEDIEKLKTFVNKGGALLSPPATSCTALFRSPTSSPNTLG